MLSEPFDAIVLTGGGARRLDGAPKHLLEVGGRSLLARVVAALSGASRVIVVGPDGGGPDRGGRDAGGGATVDVVVRERPPGGGPVAALAAGVAEVRSGRVAVLAGDLPFVTAAALDELRNAGSGAVTVAVDGRGRDQYLLAVWRTDVLRAQLSAPATLTGLALHTLYRGVDVRRVTMPGTPPPWWDCDTPDDLDLARAWAGETPTDPRRASP